MAAIAPGPAAHRAPRPSERRAGRLTPVNGIQRVTFRRGHDLIKGGTNVCRCSYEKPDRADPGQPSRRRGVPRPRSVGRCRRRGLPLPRAHDSRSRTGRGPRRRRGQEGPRRGGLRRGPRGRRAADPARAGQRQERSHRFAVPPTGLWYRRFSTASTRNSGREWATPDHVLYVCPKPCPATEPIQVPPGTVDPFPPPGLNAAAAVRAVGSTGPNATVTACSSASWTPG